MPAKLVVDVHLHENDAEETLRRDVEAGLLDEPKWLSPKWFYDERGSELFEQITTLDEYYPTRCEREILEREAKAIVAASGADTVIELGSGTSEKMLLLLDAFAEAGQLDRFVPFDVSEQTLRDAAVTIDKRYPGIAVHAVVGDFERHLEHLPSGGRRLLAFLGGTIGNFDRNQRAAFLGAVGAMLQPGECFLLGADLVKDPDRLVAAYDDAAGVTAAFNRNVLAVLNRRLGGDFPVDGFEHEARWNAPEARIEMWLRTPEAVTVHLEDPGLVLSFEADEAMRTELSCKFRRDGLIGELGAAGFALEEFWTDANEEYSLSLARRIG